MDVCGFRISVHTWFSCNWEGRYLKYLLCLLTILNLLSPLTLVRVNLVLIDNLSHPVAHLNWNSNLINFVWIKHLFFCYLCFCFCNKPCGNLSRVTNSRVHRLNHWAIRVPGRPSRLLLPGSWQYCSLWNPSALALQCLLLNVSCYVVLMH